MSATNKRHAVALISGVLFAVGLGIAGMTNPAKVLAFLDVFGAWDPSLAFVMGGAIAIYAPFYRMLVKRPAPAYEACFHVPTHNHIDKRLVVGAVLFGMGWGLAGLCPGPAVVAATSMSPELLAFVAAMMVGLVLQPRIMLRFRS